MAEAVVSFALEQIQNLVVQEGKLLCGVNDEVKSLQTQLKAIKSLLEDADRRRHENRTIADWIADIRDLSYRAEAAIELHAAQMSSRRRRTPKNLLKRYSCILNECYLIHQLATEISAIKTKLETINKDMQEKENIKNVIMDGGHSSSSINDDNRSLARKTFHEFDMDECFVGKEDDLKALISLAVDDREHRVISVWGMGGIGKTTIVKKVYNQIRKGQFESCAWVCITQNCQTRSIWEDVVKQLTPQKEEDVSSLGCIQQAAQRGEDLSSLSERELIERLSKIQRSKRCLIVLDDLWEISQWEGLKRPFHVQDLQSKILVTTRKKHVAEIGFPIKLGLLGVEDALELLKKKAFPRGKIPDSESNQKSVEEIGKEMFENVGICL